MLRNIHRNVGGKHEIVHPRLAKENPEMPSSMCEKKTARIEYAAMQKRVILVGLEEMYAEQSRIDCEVRTAASIPPRTDFPKFALLSHPPPTPASAPPEPWVK